MTDPLFGAPLGLPALQPLARKIVDEVIEIHEHGQSEGLSAVDIVVLDLQEAIKLHADTTLLAPRWQFPDRRFHLSAPNREDSGTIPALQPLEALIAAWRRGGPYCGDDYTDQLMDLGRDECADELVALLPALRAVLAQQETRDTILAQIREALHGPDSDAVRLALGLTTDSPVVVAVMGSQPACQASGCQLAQQEADK